VLLHVKPPIAATGRATFSVRHAADGSLRQFDVPHCRATAQASEIAVFDFLSHEHMQSCLHEGYLASSGRHIRRDRISFRAVKTCRRLGPRVADLQDHISALHAFETCWPVPPQSDCRRRAARQCLNVMTQGTAERSVRFTALLVSTRNLLVVIGHGWPPYPRRRYT